MARVRLAFRRLIPASRFGLAWPCFAVQSSRMETKQAAEHLQVIRTLMERSALYRRALAPIMTFAGLLGVLAAGTGLLVHLDSTRVFAGLWLGTAVVAVAGAFLIARRQAFKDNEGFWSPPTRRVAQALSAPLAVGLMIGIWFVFPSAAEGNLAQLAILWVIFYGCALHSAGFFMPRGVRWFGWIFIFGAFILLFYPPLTRKNIRYDPQWVMGFFFGVLHLAYGAYLYFTEQRKNVA